MLTERRTMLAILALSFFCIVTVLGATDSALVSAEAKIKLPFANADIAFLGFLVAAPFMLVVLTIYLHVFENSRLEFEASNKIKPIPTLFTIDRSLPRILSNFIFYWLVPFVLGIITWKALARLEWGLPLLLVTILVALILLWKQIRRCPDEKRLFKNAPRWGILIGIVFISGYAVWDQDGFSRPLNLLRADLSGKVLAGDILRHADLTYANLKGADLSRADLRGASFYEAHLEGTLLDKANLQDAMIINANLQGASLTSANLQGAKLNNASLKGAILSDANLQGATLSYARIQGATLSGAHLEGALLDSANLQAAYLFGAYLEGADLSKAHLEGALLDSANLWGANLSGAHLRGASFKNAGLWRTFGRFPEEQLPVWLDYKPQLQAPSKRQLIKWACDLQSGDDCVDKRKSETKEDILQGLIDKAVQRIHNKDAKDRTKFALARLSSPEQGVADSLDDFWNKLANDASEKQHQEDLSERLVMLACLHPFIARGLVTNYFDGPRQTGMENIRGKLANTIVKAMDSKRCPGLNEISGIWLAGLRTWAAQYVRATQMINKTESKAK